MTRLMIAPFDHRPMPPLTVEEIYRFQSKQVRGSFGPYRDCTVIWGGGKNEWNAQGYGRFCIWRDGRRIRLAAHRVAFYIATGEDPGYSRVRHYHCDFRPCNTPGHLVLGTDKDNVHDTLAHRRHHMANLKPFQPALQAALEVLATGEKRKLCIRCGHDRDLDEFDENPANPDGLEFWCSLCCGAVQIDTHVRRRRRGRLRSPA